LDAAQLLRWVVSLTAPTAIGPKTEAKSNGNGYAVQCNDGQWSMSGGEQGACSYRRGESGYPP
jgi:hypothetical protein